jgi:5-methylcytosine-specific restriction endonuclease McrA
MGTPGKRVVERYEYAEYIKSKRWRAVRDRYWASRLPKACYICGVDGGTGMDLHHRTYKNLGNERLMDLVPLCRPCHQDVHDLHRSKGDDRTLDLWAATKKARKRHLDGRSAEGQAKNA